MTTKRDLIAPAVASCAVLLLAGCSLDRPPVALGPAVVTAGSGRDQAAPNDHTAKPTTDDPSDAPSTCGPSPGTQQSTRGARAVPAPFRDDRADLDVDSQAGDGRTVFVEEAQLTRTDGFVVVCALDNNRLLGYYPITRSADELTVRVTLSHPITTTMRLLVVLYADNGDRHFDWATDPRVSGDVEDITDLEVQRFTYRYGA